MKFRGKTKLWAGRIVAWSPFWLMVLYLGWLDPEYGRLMLIAVAGAVVTFYLIYLGNCWVRDGKAEAEDDQ